MPSYPTLDYLPDLSASAMANAIPLNFTPAAPNTVGWDLSASYASTYAYASLHETFSFTAIAGSTLDFASSSFFDPFLIELYDNLGNVIAVNQPDSINGTDFLNSYVAPYTGTYYVDAGWHQGSYYTAVAFIAEIDLDTIPKKPDLIVTGTSGNDVISATTNNDIVDGGAGIDTMRYYGNKASFSVTSSGGKLTVVDLTYSSGTDVLTDVERIQFADTALSFETTGHAAEAYRLYKAAFNRTPDADGLGFWIHSLDVGVSTADMAYGFTNSAEWTKLYGSNPSNQDVLTAIYKNVLHRAPDQSGYDYWMGILNDHKATLPEVLVYFSESPENQAQVIGSLQAGYAFIPHT